ncbi:efflux RND transporter periplasmic adaptor subunit [Clostridium psychrophilum]|uniref:efflux RND transporter periplasmic adaptor subunit n=1 Tax=Clostridium psychrophilum TaxID=132926 RepID=UPI001C0E4BB6|nr:efflux RND transporter periplasmic adaptor subunit [Clostridium psychrophilum]MBU3182945.1 efflux RND transporter periplasmic adaptor subunit [Clostridium psychrophilum]
MKSKMIKAIIISISVIVIFIGGYIGYNKFFKKTATATTTKFYSSTVKTMSISNTIQGTGAAYAGTTSDVSPNNNGTLSGLTVKVGDTVTKAQELFYSSNSDLAKTVTSSTKKLTKANAQLASDETNLTTKNTQLITDETVLTTAKAQLATDESAPKVDSNKVTSDNKSIDDTTNKITSDEKTITDNTSKISDDKDSVTDAISDLTSAKTAVSNQTVIAPIAGLVTTVVSANGSTGKSGKSTLTISDMNTMKVKVSVDELDISSVKVGQKATIKFDAITGKTFTGTVESAAQTGTTTDNTTTYDVIVSINNPTGIRLGMNANVTIAVKSKDEAIVIPEEALVESNNKKYVRVQNAESSDSGQSNSSAQTTDSNSKLVEITTGIETEDYIEVTKGITAGQVVLVQLATSSSSTTTQSGMGGQGGSMSGSGGVGKPSGGRQPSGSSSSSSTSTK